MWHKLPPIIRLSKMGNPMSKPFDDYYADVPADQRERLRAFRAAHTPRHVQVGAVPWEYLAGGSGDQTVLLLVGGLRAADAGFRMASELERDFRVLVPTYPAVPAMTQLCDGLAALLDAEGVQQVNLLAGSFGGMVAQAFVRAQPQRVRRLVLSTTAVPDANAVRRYEQQLAQISPVPDELVRAGAKVQMLEMVAPPGEELAFWRAYLDELFSERLGKADVLSTYQCIIDFGMSYRLQPGDLDNWGGKLLLIESDDDATFDAAQRAALRGLYPQAQVHTFMGAGHSPGTTRRSEYTALVHAFFHID